MEQNRTEILNQTKKLEGTDTWIDKYFTRKVQKGRKLLLKV